MKRILYLSAGIALIACLGGCAPTNANSTPATALSEETDAQTSSTAVDSEDEVIEETTMNVSASQNGYAVAIDAGHQAVADATNEHYAPSSDGLKPCVGESFIGKYSGNKESELMLKIAQCLDTELQNRGYGTLMIRENEAVNIRNQKRAVIANESGADIVIHLHAAASNDSSVNGAVALIPAADNPYVSDIYGDCYLLGNSLVNGLCGRTNQLNRGSLGVNTMTSINWSSIPVTILETGYLTNASDDNYMNDSANQKQMAEGIADGVDAYFAAKNPR